jgi:hypothetical protein
VFWSKGSCYELLKFKILKKRRQRRLSAARADFALKSRRQRFFGALDFSPEPFALS